MTELIFKIVDKSGNVTGKTARIKLSPELGRGLLHAITHPPAEDKAWFFSLGETGELIVYHQCIRHVGGGCNHQPRPLEYVLPKAQRASIHCIPAFVPGLMEEIDLSGT